MVTQEIEDAKILQELQEPSSSDRICGGNGQTVLGGDPSLDWSSGETPGKTMMGQKPGK